jgi:uncharacterized protein (TIGR03435 family)
MMLSDVLSPLADHLWQSTVFVIAAALLTLVLRKNHAGARFWIWWIASAKFLIPFSLLVAIGGSFHWPAIHESLQEPPASLLIIEQFAQPFAVEDSAISVSTTVPVAPELPTYVLPLLVAGIWLTGSVLLLSRWAIRWIRLRSLARHALRTDELVGYREVDLLRRLEHAAGIQPIAIVSSPAAIEPSIFGIFRSVLVWPAGLSSRLDDEELEAILLHELSHVRRRDNLAAAVHMLVECVFWFHPLVWWIGSRLVQERETACDEDVLRCGHLSDVYAESILKVCEFCLATPLRCASGITGSDLKKRIAGIMKNRVAARLTRVKRLLLTGAAITALTIPIVAGVIHASTRQRETLPAIPAVPAVKFVPPSPTPLLAQVAAPLRRVTPAAVQAPQQDSFDVISIRPAAPIGAVEGGGRGGGGGGRGGGGGNAPTCPPAPAGGMQIDAGRITIRNATPFRLIVLAYAFSCRAATEMDLINGLPEWAKTERFDVQATFPAGMPPVTAQQLVAGEAPRLQRMLQNMLADRFRMAARRSSKDAPLYNLVVVKPGKIILSADQTPPPPPPPPNPNAGPIVPAPGEVPQRRGGFSLGVDPPAGKVMIEATAVPMATLINIFQGQEGRFVVDKTGMKGLYDIPMQTLDVGTFDIGPGAVSVWPEIMQGLGLKLEPARGPVDIAIIDRIERPSEN